MCVCVCVCVCVLHCAPYNEDEDMGTYIQKVQPTQSVSPRYSPPGGSILKFVVCSFGPESVLLTEGSILHPWYEIWE